MKKIILTLIYSILIYVCKPAEAQTNDQRLYDQMKEWVKAGNTQYLGKIFTLDLYAKRSSWGLGQQFYAANVYNPTSYKVRYTGELYATLLCGNEAVSKFDFVLSPYQTLNKANMGSLNMDFLSDATGLISSADDELCKGDAIIINGKKYGVNRIKSLGYRNVKAFALEGGEEIQINANGVLLQDNKKANLNQGTVKEGLKDNSPTIISKQNNTNNGDKLNTETEKKRIKDSIAYAQIKYQNERKNLHQDEKRLMEENTKQNTGTLTSGVVDMANLFSKGIESNNQNNFFRGKSVHLGLNLGFVSPTIPIVINQTSTSTSTSNNRPTTYSSNVRSPGQIGLIGGLNFDPIMSDYITFGISGSVVYAFSTSFISGGGASSDTDLGSTTMQESASTINYNYGGQLAFGAKWIKLLGGYYFNNYNTAYSNTTSSDIYVGNNTLSDNTNEYGSTAFSSQRLEIGVRLGNYKKTCYDLVYGQETYKDYNLAIIKNPILKISIWNPSVFKFFVEYSNKYAAYGKNDFSWENKGEDKKKDFINIGIVYNKDWFWGKK